MHVKITNEEQYLGLFPEHMVSKEEQKEFLRHRFKQLIESAESRGKGYYVYMALCQCPFCKQVHKTEVTSNPRKRDIGSRYIREGKMLDRLTCHGCKSLSEILIIQQKIDDPAKLDDCLKYVGKVKRELQDKRVREAMKKK